MSLSRQDRLFEALRQRPELLTSQMLPAFQSLKEVNIFLREQLEPLGFHTSAFDEEGGLLIAQYKGTGSTRLFLYSHAAPEPVGEWRTILAWVTALQVCHRDGENLPISLCWIFVPSPMSSSESLLDLCKKINLSFAASLCLCSHGELVNTTLPIVSEGARGRLGVTLDLECFHTPVPVQEGTILPNAVWRLVWALSSIKDAHEELLIEGFYDDLLSPSDEEIELLHELPDTSVALARRWGVAGLLLGLRGFQLQYARHLMPGCSITLIESKAVTDFPALPGKARAELDFSLLPDQQPETILQLLRQHLQEHGFEDIIIDKVHAISPIRPGHEEVVERIFQQLRTRQLCWGRLSPGPSSLSLSHLWQIMQIPIVSLGISTPDPFLEKDIYLGASQLLSVLLSIDPVSFE